MSLRALAAATGLMALAWTGTAQAAELVSNGDFEAGRTNFLSSYSFGNVHFGGATGSYNLATSPAAAPGAWDDWMTFGDHTTGDGLMMVLNGPALRSHAYAWAQVVSVMRNSTYTLSFWAATLNLEAPVPAQIQAYVNGVALGPVLTLPRAGGEWVSTNVTWDSGMAKIAAISLVDTVVAEQWNDFVLDDISFQGTPGGIVVPEPATWVSMLVGFGALGAMLRLRSAGVAVA